MNRRAFLYGVGAQTVLVAASARVEAQTGAFAETLAALARDPDALDAANSLRERYQPIPGAPLGAQNARRRRASSIAVSARAEDLIVTCEVSSRQLYERRYQSPVWPGGLSGVTIGIGYDLGYATPTAFERDWLGILDASKIATLSTVCGLSGEAARD